MISRENANTVLKEVQNARNTLEQNILEVCRNHEQKDLFSYLDGPLRCGDEENDAIRIKRQVNEKIKHIRNEISDEVYNSNRGKKGDIADQKRGRLPYIPGNCNPGNRNIPGNRNPTKPILRQQPPKTTKTPVDKTPGKQKPKKGKSKETKKAEPPPKSSTAYDELVIQHIYGRQPHQAHRHTFKTDKPGFCSIHKVNTNKAKTMVDSHSVVPVANQPEIRIQPKDQYCIHLQQHTVPFSIENNFPSAIALNEPSRCLSDRLPLPTVLCDVNETKPFDVNETKPFDVNETKSPKMKARNKQLSKAGPNVAVINIKAYDDDGKTAIKNRIKSKVRDRLKNRLKLNVQPLPNVDIDTTDSFTSSAITSDSSQSTIHNPDCSLARTEPSVINESSKNVVDAGDENHYDFQEFIAVQDISNKNVDISEDEVQSDVSIHKPQIALDGCRISRDENEHHGPSFPPVQCQKTNDFIETPVHVKTTPTLQQTAQDLIEKELLARLISQMVEQQENQHIPFDNVSLVSIESHNDCVETGHDWIDNIIGLQGLQIFVDAGIPVNKELIKDIIRCVILEYLETLFGHPPPEKVVKTVPQQPPVVETKIPTPISTPVGSPCASEQDPLVTTPDQSISDLTEQNIDDIIETSVVEPEEHPAKDTHEVIATPETSILEEPLVTNNKDVVTPDVSFIEHVVPDVNEVDTPRTSDKTAELTQIPLNDFEMTEKLFSPYSTIPEDRLTNKEFEITPPPVVIKKASPVVKSPSLPSTTITTTSSSSVVGLSTFDEISDGEFLNPDSAVSDLSEGEVRLNRGFRSSRLTEDLNETIADLFNVKPPVSQRRRSVPSRIPRSVERVHRRNGNLSEGSKLPPRSVVEKNGNRRNENLSEGEISRSFQPLKSIGELSDIGSDQSDVATEDIATEDLFVNGDDEVNVGDILNDDNNPVVKLIRKIKSPPTTSRQFDNNHEKSEGEVSIQHLKPRVGETLALQTRTRKSLAGEAHPGWRHADEAGETHPGWRHTDEAGETHPGWRHRDEAGETHPGWRHRDEAGETHEVESHGRSEEKGSLSIGMLNEESDFVSSIQDDDDDSNSTPLPVIDERVATDGRIITVKPMKTNVDDDYGDILPSDGDVLRSDGEILNTRNGSEIDFSKSDGELLNIDSDSEEADNIRTTSGQDSVGDDESPEKVVMVLRLPEVEDEQNVSDDDDDITAGDISTISEFSKNI